MTPTRHAPPPAEQAVPSDQTLVLGASQQVSAPALGGHCAACAGSRQGQSFRTHRRAKGSVVKTAVGFPGPQDLLPRSAHPPALAKGLCQRPRWAGWETEYRVARSKPSGDLPRGLSGP